MINLKVIAANDPVKCRICPGHLFGMRLNLEEFLNGRGLLIIYY